LGLMHSVVKSCPRPTPSKEPRLALRQRLKELGIYVAKRTIQKYMRQARKGTSPGSEAWSTFLKEHAHQIWACDNTGPVVWHRPVSGHFKQVFAFRLDKFSFLD
jgi:hypothetical protein